VEKNKRVGAWGRSIKISENENGKKERRARMSEGIVRAVFFCVFSVFSI